jgi:hypothetical protein
MTKSKSTVTVVDDPEHPVDRQVLATAIRDISKAMNGLLKSGLNRRAITLLVWDACTAVPKTHVQAVLDALPDLEKRYCR